MRHGRDAIINSWRGVAGSGGVRSGMVRQGATRHGAAWQGRDAIITHDPARQGTAGFGTVGRDVAWRGEAGMH